MVQVLRTDYQAIGEFIWVEYPEASMAGMLHLPEKQKEPPYVETSVLSVGDKVTEVKAGDRILLNFGAIAKFMLDGRRLAFTKADKILAIVKPVGRVELKALPDQ